MPGDDVRAVAADTFAATHNAQAIHRSRGDHTEAFMDQETFNLSIRKFLKTVGVNSQREIEQAVAKAVAAGTISGTQSLVATMTLQIAGLQLNVQFDGEINLQ
jgi:uncharacterized protein DUF6494